MGSARLERRRDDPGTAVQVGLRDPAGFRFRPKDELLQRPGHESGRYGEAALRPYRVARGRQRSRGRPGLPERRFTSVSTGAVSKGACPHRRKNSSSTGLSSMAPHGRAHRRQSASMTRTPYCLWKLSTTAPACGYGTAMSFADFRFFVSIDPCDPVSDLLPSSGRTLLRDRTGPLWRPKLLSPAISIITRWRTRRRRSPTPSWRASPPDCMVRPWRLRINGRFARRDDSVKMQTSNRE